VYTNVELESTQTGAYQLSCSTFAVLQLKLKFLTLSHLECDLHQRLIISTVVCKEPLL